MRTHNATLMPKIDVELTEAEFRRISDIVYRYCGINLHDGKRELVQARVSKQMRTGGFASVSEYVDHVLADASGAEFLDLIAALSTNLTSFFRENGHFEYLSREFMPALIERKRREGRLRIRGWSAACSTGEEPCSLAMMLLEGLAGHGTWDVKILATDVSTRVLRNAERGVYAKDRVQSIPVPLRNKYMAANRIEGGVFFSVMPAVREMICFRHLNLIDKWPFTGPFDFIFCRNVMIYFDKPTQQTLVNRLWDCVDRGGLLFTGHSESLTGISHKFAYVQPTIYRKV